VRNRKNLRVETLAMVTGLKMDGTRCVGVDYLRAGRLRRSVTAGDVILCGGAFNSPQLLQLAGIGDPQHLESVGVRTVTSLPGVGANMQDHLEVYIQHECTQPVSIAPWLAHRHKPRIGAEWLFGRRGVGASNHFEAGGFIRSNDEVGWPNLMFHFLPIAIRYDGSQPAAEHGYQVHIGPMYADTRGTCLIRSTDPTQHPAIRFNYLSTENDRREWVEMVRAARLILGQPAFAAFSGGEISPGPSVETDEEILEWVAQDGETALHPSCTARMGTDEGSVVDPITMRVHGTEGLRVVDASVFPFVTNGNIYAPVMMVAEKAADLVAGNTPLPPLDVPWYRHGRGDPLYPPGDPRNEAWNAVTDPPSAEAARRTTTTGAGS
jgi:choline dehydrogenase